MSPGNRLFTAAAPVVFTSAMPLLDERELSDIGEIFPAQVHR